MFYKKCSFLRPRAVIVLILALESLARPLVSMETYRTAHAARACSAFQTNGAQSALWAEINRQLTKIRVWRILRAVRFERFDQSTTSNNVTDWLIFLLMLAWTVTFADVGARNRQARVQNYGHCCAYNFRTFQCKYWLVTSMKIEPVVIIIIRIEYSIQKMF